MDTQLKKHIEDVEFDGLLLKHVSKEYRASKKVVLAAFEKDKRILEFASKRLQEKFRNL
jgi:hypothetical protein